MNTFHIRIGWVVALLFLPLAESFAAPNILWITIEDMSAQIGCYGDRTVPTPNVDRLAREGVRYTRAFAVYGVCAPSRCALITGLYPASIGAMHMRTWKRTASIHLVTDPELLAIPVYEATPPPEVKCFTEYLQANGYYCSNNKKRDYQFRAPLTAWDESSETAHWRNRPPGMPFFSVFNIKVTHESGVFDELFSSQQVTDPEKVTVPPYYPDTPMVRRDIARNYDNIAEADRQIGKILAELEADGLLNETIIFYFSDHGSGLPRAKRWVYDSGIHVPFIIRYPDGKGAATLNDDLVSFVDFAPSMLSLTGLDIPHYMQGQAFLGPLKAAPRKYIFAGRDRMDPAMERIRATRDKRFKYVRNFLPELPYLGFIPYRDRMGLMQEILRLKSEGKLGPDQWQLSSDAKPLEELYDTEADPHEIRNLAADPAHFQKLAELRAALEDWLEESGDLGHVPETELVKRLWPPDGVQPTTENVRVVSTRQVDTGSVEVTLGCPTEGASIAYKFTEAGPWELYHRPFVAKASSSVWLHAHRIGFKPSETMQVAVSAK